MGRKLKECKITRVKGEITSLLYIFQDGKKTIKVGFDDDPTIYEELNNGKLSEKDVEKKAIERFYDILETTETKEINKALK